MTTLFFQRKHYLPALLDELLASVPALAPVNGQAQLQVTGDGDSLTVYVPDSVDPALILSVVSAHDADRALGAANKKRFDEDSRLWKARSLSAKNNLTPDETAWLAQFVAKRIDG